MADKRASIGFALICKDGKDTLEACLKSIRPYVQQIVVGVDTLTTDKTERIARRCGADVIFPVEVSEWHECEQHGRIRAQHFARARQASFARLDPTLDFHAWIDADDVIDNAAMLPALAKSLPEQAIGTWHPYWYASVVKDGVRQVNTLFHRERLLRTHYRGNPVEWEWQHRVHEVVAPKGVISPQWVQNEEIRWVHQDQAHKSGLSAPRNLTLLEIELEDEPDQPRTVFYIANQYFAVGDWFNATQWYEAYVDRFRYSGNPYELWQSYVYLSLAYERLGDLAASKAAAFGAVDAMPNHPEPYYRLAALYAAESEPEKAVYWTQRADECPDAPFFAFKNPMDRGFNKWLPLADAYVQMGQVSEAHRCWQEAVKTFPDETVQERVKMAEHKLLAEKGASDFVGMAGLVDADEALRLYDKLPNPVKAFGRARNVAMSVLRQRRKALTQPRITFYCPGSWEPWAPSSMNTTGIGGSETAVVEVARRFAAAGWLVDVYGNPDYMEGEHDGVGYWDLNRYAAEPCDVFVSWRRASAHALAPAGAKKVLWCHDLHYGPEVAEDMAKWDVVAGVSQWHADMLGAYYAVAADFFPNGIDLSRFAEPVKKVPYRCVYASSPDRGLARLLSLWPLLRKTEPTAELHVAYGWETMDKMIATGRSDLQAFKDGIMARIEKSEGIVWRGRLPQTELANLYAESYVWLYPTDFLEVSCISAMEAMAGGAIPITTRCGALPETVSDAGLLVPGPTTSRGYQETWVNAARGAMGEFNLRMTYSTMARARAKELTWDAAFERWVTVLGLDVSGRGNNLGEASASTETGGTPCPDGCAPLPKAPPSDPVYAEAA